ncbi:MAG: hypothetical protein ABL958_04225 [Bdellovibrionia bacterium]
MKCVIALLLIAGSAFAGAPKARTLKFTRNPAQAVDSQNARDKFGRLVQCYSDNQNKYQRFLECSRKSFLPSIDEDTLKELTTFLTLSKEVFDLRACTPDEIAFGKKTGATGTQYCFDLVTHDDEKRLGLGFFNANSIITDIRVF